MSGGISFAPLLPWPLIAIFGAISIALLGLALMRGGRGIVLRATALTLIAAVALNPRMVEEDRKNQPDIAVIVIDESQSQSVGERKKQNEAALEKLRAEMERFGGLEVNVIRTRGGGPDAAEDSGTRLIDALSKAMTSIPQQRFAGAVLITDGQVHDAPQFESKAAKKDSFPGPVHVLLNGNRNEADRRLIIEKAPAYGIVGGDITLRFRVEDFDAGDKKKTQGANLGTRAGVRLLKNGIEVSSGTVPVGRSETFSVKLDHAGQTVLELIAEEIPGELSTLNNRAVLNINGVRDRLRVLLVSGQPHAGERTWRNLLKSDPSVDLVHFTILRTPEKQDFTPLDELSLIVFPVRELFEVKLKEFDLIVFDRYELRNVLPPAYIRNIEKYVREGGALMLSAGPEFAGLRSLFRSPLGAIMPGKPSGRVLEGGFKPLITELGQRHPVTALLDGATGKAPTWGRWFRQIETKDTTGTTLMQGIDGGPLLILDRVDKGRIAQLMSDQIWLWAREFEGGGPQGELLRRLAHWLMKEPDLEEKILKASIKSGILTVRRRSLGTETPEITVTTPSGEEHILKLEHRGPGVGGATLPAEENGLYRVTDGTQTALAAAGTANPLELADLRATAQLLTPLVKATGGGIHWLADGLPELRRTQAGRDSAGRGWIGFTENRSYMVAGIIQNPLLPGLAALVLVLGMLMAAWWREGH
ncbi:MAG: hypothetical protein OEY85_00015 [Rhodospirillales bacterium]|nr:hypothetical protein [Rhodospirillales bacterium]